MISPPLRPGDWCRWSDFYRFNSDSAWSSGRNLRRRQINLPLWADHSRTGTERRRTHPHNSRKRPRHSRKSGEA
jgi:hypothetical protein